MDAADNMAASSDKDALEDLFQGKALHHFDMKCTSSAHVAAPISRHFALIVSSCNCAEALGDFLQPTPELGQQPQAPAQ